MKILKTLGIFLLAFIFITVGQLIGLATYPINFIPNQGIQFGFMYLVFIGIWLVTIPVCLRCKSFRKHLPKLGTSEAGNNLKTALPLGLALGMGLNLFVAIVALIHKDITLTFSSFNPWMLLYFVVIIMIQSGAEELVTRWFIYENVKEYYPNYPIIAIVGNAAFFLMIHLGNSGVSTLALVNLFLVGLLYSLVVYYYKSFWAAVVAHTSWNFCQNILLGLPNSGAVSKYAVFTLNTATAKDSFAYNTAFGIEGSILTSIVLVIACLLVYYMAKRKENACLAQLDKRSLLGSTVIA